MHRPKEWNNPVHITGWKPAEVGNQLEIFQGFDQNVKFVFWPVVWRQKPRPLLQFYRLKIIWDSGSSGSGIWSVSGAGLNPFPSRLPVFGGVRWSMAAPWPFPILRLGWNLGPLRELIWRAPSWDIERALFGDASSFLPVRDIYIPKFPPSCVPALCWPPDLFFPPFFSSQSSPTWLAHQAGQCVVAVSAASTQKPLSMSCN